MNPDSPYERISLILNGDVFAVASSGNTAVCRSFRVRSHFEKFAESTYVSNRRSREFNERRSHRERPVQRGIIQTPSHRARMPGLAIRRE